MNKSEHYEFQERFDKFMIDNDINSMSTFIGICKSCGDEVDDIPNFSWSPCECCGSSLGGDRYHVSGYSGSLEEVLCFEICHDCFHYEHFGQLDDMEMLAFEDSVPICDYCGNRHDEITGCVGL